MLSYVFHTHFNSDMGCGTVANVVRADSAGPGAPEDEFTFVVKRTQRVRVAPVKFLLELQVDVVGDDAERKAHLEAQTNYEALVAHIGRRRFSVFGIQRAEGTLIFKILSETERLTYLGQTVRFLPCPLRKLKITSGTDVLLVVQADAAGLLAEIGKTGALQNVK